ncbi:glycosyltransferase family 39 protein [Hymenobacter sp. J193]|uniref:glycosyltransferase family 39 protein n=1 Tax=Hymenobacter sp. J193 TaxID=2898429 RepID=UPI002150DB2F|nr:glycosyltransferase family 39 protein [Hymenobacter sp. J193]MCR5887276.1 glycosyltransferase family 39 protein [Hymenobacter sp. J193]
MMPSPAPTRRFYGGWLVVLAMLRMAAQYQLTHPSYQLHRDEYLHLDQANHLAWGYISLPPLTSWVAWLVQALGNSEFWVHFFPALFGVFTLALVWALVHELGGGLYAKLLAAGAVLFSALLRINLLFQPNSFDVLAWTAATYCLVRYLRTERLGWMLGVGAALGLGLLNKYNIVFWAAGIAPALLLSKHRARVFGRRAMYLAAGLALLIFLPNLLWQVQHNFPVVWHMQELKRTQLVNVQPADFLKSQLLFFLNSLWLLVAAGVGLARWPALRPYRFLGWSVLLTLAIFLALRAKDYYAIGLYPPLLAVGAVYMEHLLQAGRWRYLRPVLPLVQALLFIPMLRVAFPLQPPAALQRRAADFEALGLLRWEDGRNHPLPQDFADMLGWREMADQATRAYQLLPDSLRAHTLVLCDNYGQTGAINYYAAGRLPPAVSFNADYVYWFPDLRSVQAIVLVSEDGPDAEDGAHFRQVRLIGRVTEPLAREHATRVLLLIGPDKAIITKLQQRLKDRQQLR